jgi:hypothetical protein
MRNEVGLGAERHCQLGRGVARAPLPREMLGDTHPHSVAPCRAIFILLTDPGLKPWAWSLALKMVKQPHKIGRNEGLVGVL